jgi:DNA gyrase/topoisomerase IV subunit B
MSNVGNTEIILRMPQTGLLAKALLAYSVDEHQLGHTRRVEVRLAPEHLTLQDDGRGMGLDRGSYVGDLLGILVGRSAEVQLHGIGLSLVAAVTPLLEIESRRGDRTWKQSFELGVAREAPAQSASGPSVGTRLTLTGLPPASEADVASLLTQSKVWQAANPGLAIVLHGNLRPGAQGRVA